MLEVRVKWAGDMQFIGTNATRHSLVMDSVAENGGGTGFKPTDLLMIGLAGCTGMDVASILRKARQDIVNLEIVVSGEQDSEPPWAFQRLHIEFVIRGRDVREEVVRRAIQLSEERYCSVGATIRCRAGITTSYRIEGVADSYSQ